MANIFAANGQSFDSFSTMSTIGQANLIGSGVTAIGNFLTAKINAKTANYLAEVQAQMAEENAKMEELKANAALHAANQEVSAITMKYGQVKSSQKTAFAANGIKVAGAGKGTVAEVLTTTDLYKEMDAHTAFMNGMSSAWGYRNRATAMKGSAMSLRASKVNTGLVAAGSLFAGLQNVGSTVISMASYNNPEAVAKPEEISDIRRIAVTNIEANKAWNKMLK